MTIKFIGKMHNMYKQTDKDMLEKVLLTLSRKGRHMSATKGGGKILEDAANNEEETFIDPLQHDVFGSEVGGPKPTIMKEHRESLRELFQKTNMMEEKAEPTRSIRIVKKKDTERKNDPPFSKRSTLASVGTLNSTSANKKLHKIPHMLHKVQTEAPTISQKSQNLWKDIANNNRTKEEDHRNTNRMQSEDNILFPYREITKMSLNLTKSKVSHIGYNGGTDTIWKRECWIRSDAEYLILEL